MKPKQFFKAAAHGNLKLVDKFLEDGGDANTCDEVRCVRNHTFFYSTKSIIEDSYVA